MPPLLVLCSGVRPLSFPLCPYCDGDWVVRLEQSFNIFLMDAVVLILGVLYHDHDYARFFMLETIARVPYFAIQASVSQQVWCFSSCQQLLWLTMGRKLLPLVEISDRVKKPVLMCQKGEQGHGSASFLSSCREGWRSVYELLEGFKGLSPTISFTVRCYRHTRAHMPKMV
ncbi:uncharacterized protein LOC119299294 [Triticum dicoccoides]|uniref:uncharacterized protein LOC119299294 n=1 Tax=Triticum dicoccoides TaxID=85692 RepID=UPI00188FC9E5|nr:uncharacterized protein LOC119299294 [Triticum dicoccoides]